MSVKIIGLNKLLTRLAELPSSLDRAARTGIKRVAEEIRDDAKNLCPVDTGSLRESIRVQVATGKEIKTGVSAGGYVTNPKTGRKVDYAAHIEYGTSRSRAQPFMRPAVEKHKDKIPREVRSEIK